MTGSRWPAVADALVAALTTASANPASPLYGAAVLDGPAVGAASALAAVAVGWQFDDDVDAAGSIDQSYRTTGGASAWRDESAEIACAVRVVSGDTAISATRLAAFALLDGVSALLRATPDLGLAGVLTVDLASGRVRQAQSPDGCGVVVEFAVRVVSVI